MLRIQAFAHIPALLGRLIQEADFGGSQRRQLSGKTELLNSLFQEIKEAKAIEVIAFILQIIQLNPTTRFIRNTAGVGIISYATYKGLEYGGGKIVEWTILQTTKKIAIETIQNKLISLLKENYISIDTYNMYLLEMSKTRKLPDLLQMSKMLTEKVFTRL